MEERDLAKKDQTYEAKKIEGFVERKKVDAEEAAKDCLAFEEFENRCKEISAETVEDFQHFEEFKKIHT
ncbi:hypothetical protein L484_022702 [Morus notabilis]|uniref:Uncharacterized protein n=1 Tax=Morus notabilis TaxID=981085 RepID=W9QXN9_9ROSA|nr:hypothetical protein L484_022702 [Morus notabilis]